MKISYSQLLNIVLVAILATSVFFMNTRSTIETKTASAGTYDPWLDYNEDGYVGIDDIFSTASNFGAEGDPTKNVNVTNFPAAQLEPSWQAIDINPSVGYYNFSWSNWVGVNTTLDVLCGGYSKAFVYMGLYNVSYTENYGISVAITSIMWELRPTNDLSGLYTGCSETLPPGSCNITHIGGISGGYISKMMEIETKANSFHLGIQIDCTKLFGWAQLRFFVYLRKD